MGEHKRSVRTYLYRFFWENQNEEVSVEDMIAYVSDKKGVAVGADSMYPAMAALKSISGFHIEWIRKGVFKYVATPAYEDYGEDEQAIVWKECNENT